MSSRLSFLFAVLIILVAVFLRAWDLTTLPQGFSDEEIVDIRITEAVRNNGNISVFYDLGSEGREGLYHITVATLTTFIGNGTLSYRIISLWAGLLTLALTYAIGIRLFGRFAGLSATAFMAFGFLPVIMSRHITPEVFLPLLLSAILLALAQALPTYRRRQKRTFNTTIFAFLGVFTGLALYIHPIGLLIVLLVAIFMIYMLRFTDQQMSHRRLRYIRFSVLLTIIMAIPYVTSSIRRPTLNGFSRVIPDGGLQLQNMIDSLVGLVINGDSNPLYNLINRPLIDPVTALFIVVGIGICVKNWRQPRYSLMLIGLITLLPAALFTPNAPNFAQYTVLLPIIALIFGLAVHRITSSLSLSNAKIITVCVVGLLAFNFMWTSFDLFNRWADSSEVQEAYNAPLGQLAHYIDGTAHDIPTVICGWSPDQLPSSAELTQAQIIALMFNHRNSPVRFSECNTGIVLTNGGEDQQVIVPDNTVLETSHPLVAEWLQQGEFIEDSSVPNNSVMMMNVVDNLADRLGTFTVTRPIRFAPEVGISEEQFGPPISFGGNLTFLGYESVDEGEYNPGSTVTIATYWRADGSVPTDLRLFVHILADPGASPAANFDTISTIPSRLQDRDIIVQITYVQIPEAMPAGEYTVSVGAYQDSSNIRLDVLEDGEPRGDRLFLYTIVVADPDEQETSD